MSDNSKKRNRAELERENDARQGLKQTSIFDFGKKQNNNNNMDTNTSNANISTQNNNTSKIVNSITPTTNNNTSNNSNKDQSTTTSNTNKINYASKIIHHKDKGRFELKIDGLECELLYKSNDEELDFYHTEVPAELQNRGIAGALCEFAFNYALNNGLSVKPTCTYITKHFLPRNPKYYAISVDKSGNKLQPPKQTNDHKYNKNNNVTQPQQQNIKNNNNQPTNSQANTNQSRTENKPTSNAPKQSINTNNNAANTSSNNGAADRNNNLSTSNSNATRPNNSNANTNPNTPNVSKGLDTDIKLQGPVPLPHHQFFTKPWAKKLSAVNDAYKYFTDNQADVSSDEDDNTPIMNNNNIGSDNITDSKSKIKLKKLLELASLLTTNNKDNELRSAGLEYFISECLSSSDRRAFYNNILPFMLDCIIHLPKLFSVPSIQPLQSGVEATINLTRIQICCLLSCAFFSIHAVHKQIHRYKSVNFDTLFILIGKKSRNTNSYYRLKSGETEAQKLRCILQYFDVMRVRPAQQRNNGIVTFHRSVLKHSKQDVVNLLQTNNNEISSVKVFNDGTIEDDIGSLQIDFANKHIGGGVLASGCIQEEIRFVINPECLISILFTEVMEDNECVVIIGAERFSNYTGYSNSFQFSGVYNDNTKVDIMNRISTVIVAIDAIQFYKPIVQFQTSKIVREIYKAYVGFCIEESIVQSNFFNKDNPYTFSNIATGNWGCGAFNGDVPLKTCIQLLAASISKRNINYYTFQDLNCEGLEQCINMLKTKKVTIKQLFIQVIKFADTVIKNPSQAADTLFVHLHNTFDPHPNTNTTIKNNNLAPTIVTPVNDPTLSAVNAYENAMNSTNNNTNTSNTATNVIDNDVAMIDCTTLSDSDDGAGNSFPNWNDDDYDSQANKDDTNNNSNNTNDNSQEMRLQKLISIQDDIEQFSEP